MLVAITTIIYMLDNIHFESNIKAPEKVMLSGIRLLPELHTQAEPGMLYACSLSDGLAYSRLYPGTPLICVKDHAADQTSAVRDDMQPEAPVRPDDQLPQGTVLVLDDIAVTGILGACFFRRFVRADAVIREFPYTVCVFADKHVTCRS